MIAIVGAGISGLALAHELDRRAVPFVVLESDASPGGVIRSAAVDGHLLEWGPQRTRLTAPMRTLFESLGLSDELILAPADLPLLIYRDGALREVPRSFTDFFSSDVISAAARLRVLLEPLTGGARADESVAEYFTRKLGRDAYAHLVGPLYGGLYASDPADMIVSLSLAHTLRDLGIGRSMIVCALRGGGRLRTPPACSFRNGMRTLTDALYARHADHVRLDTPVLTVAGAEGAFVLQTTRGAVEAERVVFTTPAAATAALLSGIAPDLARALDSLRYNPLTIVHLHTADAVTRSLGYQVSFGEALYTRGVTFNDALFDRRGVYTAYLGGAQHPEVSAWSDDEVRTVAVAEFAKVTGARASVLSVARAAMPAWDRSWSALRGLSAPSGIHFCTNWESRPGLPGRLAHAQRTASALAG